MKQLKPPKAGANRTKCCLKWAIGNRVHVDSEADQPPYERIADEGVILEATRRRLLLQIEKGRENLWFPKKDCHPIS